VSARGRRGIAAVLTLAALLIWPGSPAAQIRRIGYLTAAALDPSYVEAFRQGLRDRGYEEGRNITVEYRAADGRVERVPDLVGDLVQRKVEVIVSITNLTIAAIRKATGTIPIVSVAMFDPVNAGFITSFAHPGGNVTGLTFDVTPEEVAKRLELFREVVPALSRVAILWNPALPGTAAYWQEARLAAPRLGLTLHSAEVRGPDDIDRAFAEMSRARVQGIFVWAESALYTHRQRVIERATTHRLPTLSFLREYVESGALVSYGPSLRDLHRRAGGYVDKILKGAKPSDLPVEQPSMFELVLNLRTAKTLGLAIPPSVLIRADRTLE
jgi:putative ABC transport system substrate-binding protein